MLPLNILISSPLGVLDVPIPNFLTVDDIEAPLLQGFDSLQAGQSIFVYGLQPASRHKRSQKEVWL